MVRIPARHDIPAVLSGRTPEIQEAYRAHILEKQRLGDKSCDMCRVAKEQKFAVGTMAVISQELAILGNKLEKGDGTLSLVANEFPYHFYNGQRVRHHLMFLPADHYAHLDDLPPHTKASYDHLLPALMRAVDLSFTRSPNNEGSSQKDHLHTHAMIFEKG